MRNIIKTIFVALPLIFFLQGCVTPDVFSPYMQGHQAAVRANQYDQQQAIAAYINYFNHTGDYRYLCEAARLGSVDAINYLRQRQIICSQ